MESARSAAEPIIEVTSDGEDAGDAIAQELVSPLASLGTTAILGFDIHFGRETHVLHRWEVWAAAYLIAGGCGDDSFIDFKTGIVTLGRDWHHRVLDNPDALADHPTVIKAAAGGDPYVLFAESVNYVISEAFKQVAGDQKAYHHAVPDTLGHADYTSKDRDEDFDFDDGEQTKLRLPRLANLFLPSTAS